MKARAKFALAAIIALAGGWFVAARVISREQEPIPRVRIPAQVLPSPNGYDKFLEATKLMVRSREVSNAFYRKPPNKRLQGELLKQNEPALKRLREGLGIAFLSPRKRWFDAYFEAALLKDLSRLMKFAGDQSVAAKDYSRAFVAYSDGLQLGARLMQGGDQIFFNVAYAIQIPARTALLNLLPRLSTRELRMLLAQLKSSEKVQPKFETILQREKYQGLQTWLALFEKDWPESYYKEFVIERQDKNAFQRLFRSRVLENASMKDVLSNYTRWIDSWIAIVKSPYAKEVDEPWPPMDYFNFLIMEALGLLDVHNAWAMHTLNRTQRSLMLAVVSIELYTREKGKLPSSLIVLAPAYLDAVPNDGFNQDRPLRYAKKGVNAVLYSLGPDCKDDRGKPVQPSPKTDPLGADKDSVGDIVFQYVLRR